MNAIPANLPSVTHAKLPATYEAAKSALAECSRIDECQEWADRAEAMASYAKQAGDDTLRKMADRIQARAIRRCGELLKQIEPKSEANLKQNRQECTLPSVTRTQAANDAGLSEHQRKTALRVANIVAEWFEEQVESAEPPTVTQLAQQGTKPAPKPLIDLEGRDEQDFKQSTRGQGFLREFAEFCAKTDAAIVARGALPNEITKIRKHVATIDAWLDQLVTRLER